MLKVRKNSGFTLLEVLISMLLVSILSVFALTSFSKVAHKIELENYINALTSFLKQAKNLSIASNSSLIVLPENNLWSDGMILVRPEDIDNKIFNKIANKNLYINKLDKPPKYLTLNFHGFGLSDKLVFDATDGIWVTNGHFDLIDKSDKKFQKVYQIKISKSGNVNLKIK